MVKFGALSEVRTGFLNNIETTFVFSVNQLIFLMVKCGVLFEVRTGFLNNIYTSFGFKFNMKKKISRKKLFNKKKKVPQTDKIKRTWPIVQVGLLSCHAVRTCTYN
jgi:hypothetical protein